MSHRTRNNKHMLLLPTEPLLSFNFSFVPFARETSAFFSRRSIHLYTRPINIEDRPGQETALVYTGHRCYTAGAACLRLLCAWSFACPPEGESPPSCSLPPQCPPLLSLSPLHIYCIFLRTSPGIIFFCRCCAVGLWRRAADFSIFVSLWVWGIFSSDGWSFDEDDAASGDIADIWRALDCKISVKLRNWNSRGCCIRFIFYIDARL